MPAVVTPPTSEIGDAGVRSASSLAPFSYQRTFDHDDVLELRWPWSILTYERIRRTDSKVASSIRSMMLPLLSAQWRVNPRGARPEVVERVADALNLPVLGDEDRQPSRTRDRFDWGFYLRHALLSRVWGFAPFEQVARIDSDGFATIRKLAVRMPHTLEDVVVAGDGGLAGVLQKPAGGGQSVLIPVDRLVVYVHDREGADWRGQSILRPVYREFLLKDHAHRVGAVHIDRNGAGIPIVNDDPDAEDKAAEAAANQKIASAWRAGSNAGGRLSAGAQARIMGVDGDLPDIIAYIRMYDEAIAQNVLDNFSSLPSAPNGSRALGTSMIDFFVRGLNAHGVDIGTVTTNHVVEDLVDWNWGTPADPEPSPSVECGEIGADQHLTASAVRQLIDCGALKPDKATRAHLRRFWNLPAEAESEEAGTEPAAPLDGNTNEEDTT